MLQQQLPQGQIFINGILLDNIRHWYAAHTGYVLQLAMAYYEKLTVRENLILAAQIKLPRTFTNNQKFERVEQVMAVVSNGVILMIINYSVYLRQACYLWLKLLLAT